MYLFIFSNYNYNQAMLQKGLFPRAILIDQINEI